MPALALSSKVDGQARYSQNQDWRSALPAIKVGCFAALGGFLFGYDSGYISGLMEMDAFNREFGSYWENVPSNIISAENPAQAGWALSTSGRSLVVSILSIGTFCGSLVASPLADRLGRRPSFMAAIGVFCIGVLIQCVARTLGVFAVGRVGAGLGVGLLSTLVPLYQSETAPRWIRGAIVANYQWAITIGLLVASVVDKGTEQRKDRSAYLIPISLQFLWAAILLTGIFFIPESPRYRIKQGRDADAAVIVARLNSLTDADHPAVRAQVQEIKDNYEFEKDNGSTGLRELFRSGERRYRDRVLVGAASQALQQLTGINFIFYYGTTWFKTAGVSDAFLASVAMNLVNVLSTPLSFWIFESLGRRPVFLSGAGVMMVAQLMTAIIGTTAKKSNVNAQRTGIAFTAIYISAFASTWGPGPWIYTGEIFPLGIRSLGLALCTASNWVWNWILGFSTPYLVDSGDGKAGLGPKIFFVWSVACIFCVLFSYFCIYETAGLSLEEVDKLFGRTVPRQSAAMNKQIKAARLCEEAADARLGTSGSKCGPKDDIELATAIAGQGMAE